MCATEKKILALIIPVYNVKLYLPALLSSLTNFPVYAIRIIFIDDLSSDNSVEVIRTWIDNHEYDCVFIRHDKNLGLSAARNSGIQRASAKYVWFIDSDDLVNKMICQKLIDTLSKNKIDIVFFNFLMVNEGYALNQGTEKNSDSTFQPEQRGLPPYTLITNQDVIFNEIIERPAFYAWAYVTRTSLLLTEEFPEGRFFEDIATTPRVLANAQSFWHIPEIAIFYRQRPGSILSVTTLQKGRDMAMVGTFLPDVDRDHKASVFFAFTHIQSLLWGLNMYREAITQRMNITEDGWKDIYTSVNTFKKRQKAKEAIKRLAGTRGRHAMLTAWLIYKLPTRITPLIAKVMFAPTTRRFLTVGRNLLPNRYP